MAMRPVPSWWHSVVRHCAAVALISASAPAQHFPAPVEQTSAETTGLAVFDLDGSFRRDLVTLSFNDGTVSLLQAESDGDYTLVSSWSVGNGPQALATADMNHDGSDDVVTINSSGLLAVVQPLFDGQAAQTWTYPFSGSPEALAVGDLNGDGDNDVVVTETQLDRIAVRLGLGATGIGPSVTYPVSARPASVALGDVDGDGVLDIVAGSSTTANVSVLRGNGLGGFLPAVGVPVGGLPLHLTCANLDGDAAADVAVTTQTPQAVQVLLADGLGGLVPTTTASLPAGQAHIAAADLDADGLSDLVVSTGGTGGTSSAIALLSAGGGALEPAVPHGVPVTVKALAVGDVDLDGRPDLLTDNGPGPMILWGDGEGGFVEPSVEAVPAAIQASEVADVNGDGFSDLLLVDKVTEEISVRLGDGVGGLAPSFIASVGAHGFLRLADLDEDGVLDLLTAGPDSVRVCLGDGQGDFAAPLTTVISREAMDVGVADMDGDGHMDVVLISAIPFGPQILHGVGILLGDGTGQLGPLQSQIEYDNFGQVVAYGVVTLTELNGDGFTDVAVLDVGGQAVRYFTGTGTGGLFFGGAFVAGQAKSLHALDLDSDSDPDLVVGSQIALGDGLGHFGPLTTIAPSLGTTSAAGDVSGDGHPDVVALSGTSRMVTLIGDGSGDFEPELYGLGSSVPRLARLNDDALPDVLGTPVVSATPGKLWISLNRTATAAWSDLGSGLAGTNGVPQLVGTGTLEPGSPGSLKLTSALENKLAVLFISKQSTPSPFKGGVLVTVPPVISFLLLTSPAGTINLTWTSWPGGAPGSHWYFQYGIVDPAGPAGVALSNAVRANQP